jgi:murein DD-endopeptidase MepM/ murein hydrolase activator NlpD
MNQNKLMPIVAQSNSTGHRRRMAMLVGGTAVASLFAMVAAFGTVADAPLPLTTVPVEQWLSPKVESISGSTGLTYMHEDRLQRGDTISSLLDRIGIDETETRRLLALPQVSAPMRALRPGTTVQAKTSEDGDLLGLWFLNPGDKLISIQPEGDSFQAKETLATLATNTVMKSGEIRSSLFAATDNAGIPDSIATQLADIFSGDIDFHRDLRKSDRFTVVYEMLSHQGRQVRPGRLLAAEFVNQQRVLRAVWFQDTATPGSKGGYYTPEGKNLRKAFLRSPLEFSRVTSGFSNRFHPILKEWRRHNGVDYGAPTGTRVRATGDGVVELVTRQGGYGNVVVIKHSGGMTTWYAHLSAFAKGLRPGMRVGQSEIIGYVGQTGWATGPHLHYEFRVHNEFRNPLTLALPTAEPITPGRLGTFQTATAGLAGQLDLLRNTNLALLE